METRDYEIIQVNQDNIDGEHICCAIGNDKTNRARAGIKKEWLKGRFPQGHIFKKVNVRGKVFIEYVPAEYAWYPIIAPGYVFIQCFWVSGRYKGHGLGKKLYQDCENDCINTNGLVAITSDRKRGFMVDKRFYLKQGFMECDFAEPYFQLVVKPFKKAPLPQFTEKAKKAMVPGQRGFTFYYSDLCPFNADWVDKMIQVVKNRRQSYRKVKITSLEQAKNSPAPMGHFSVFYQGKFLSHELMLSSTFDKLVSKLTKS